MTIDEIMRWCDEYRKKGDFYSNIVALNTFGQIGNDIKVDQTENALMFILTGLNGRNNLYFAASGKEAIVDILSQTSSKDYVIKYIYRQENNDEMREVFQKAGLNLYASYVRRTTKYKSNPYLIPEKKPHRRILQEMYDKSCGEYPVERDAEEIYEIHKESFDAISDDIFTIDEWKKKIRKQEVLVCREEGKIISYYNWQLEGRKLYSNVSVNEGPANIMYNLERRIFEEYWDEGIRIFYAWINLKNKKQFQRINENAKMVIETQHFLYQDIFCDGLAKL